MTTSRRIGPEFYDRPYYENGIYAGKSNYQGYEKTSRPHWALPLAQWIGVQMVGRVLDIGCAYGHLVRELIGIGVDAYGVDWSTYSTQNTAAPGRVLQMDGRRLLFADGSFRCVVSLDYLEHHGERQIHQAIGESVRVLEHGGLMLHLIGIDRNGTDGKPDPEGLGGDASHQWAAPLAWYEQQFEELGVMRRLELMESLNGVPAWRDTDWAGRFWVGGKL